ncbi:MAG: hypothetical protein WC326_01385 [Candidatus Delongbacteria bacterium]
MTQLRIHSLRHEDLPAWSRCEPNPTRRKACLNELKALFQSGASSVGLLWWAREDENVLARLLLVREPGGVCAGLLELPWSGAWRGLLRRVLERVTYILERQGHTRLEIGEEALAGQRVPLEELGRELLGQGFQPTPSRAVVRLRRTRTASAELAGTLPAGAELDGDDGGVWRLESLPPAAELAAGLAALAAQGALELRLEWPGDPAELPEPPAADWQRLEGRIRRAWSRPLARPQAEAPTPADPAPVAD